MTIPAGTITVTGTVSLKNGVAIKGAGVDQTILSMPNQTSATALLLGSGVSGVSVSDMTLTSPAVSGYVLALWLTNGYSNVDIERVKVTNCMYALKADTRGSNLIVRDFTALACGQSYVSNLTGGLFERLDLEMLTTSWTSAFSTHALYLEGGNHGLTFNSVKARGGSGWTVQLYTETGPSDEIVFNGLDATGYPVYVGIDFSNVTIQNAVVVGKSGEGCFSLNYCDHVTIDGFTASGGDSLVKAEYGAPSNVTLRNGTYQGSRMVTGTITNLVTQNVSFGSTPTT